MWVAAQDLPRSAAHPFYTRLNQILDTHDFDGYVEGLCQRFYADESHSAGRVATGSSRLRTNLRRVQFWYRWSADRCAYSSKDSTRWAWTIVSHGDQAKMVKRPSWDATSATASR